MTRAQATVVVATALGSIGLLACQKENPATAHIDKGDELYSKQQWKAAADEYSLALQTDPKQDKIWERKAMALLKGGDLDGGVVSLVQLAEYQTDPKKKAQMYRSVAGLYLDHSMPDFAELYFREALKSDPKDGDALAWLGEIASQRGGARSNTSPGDPVFLEKAVSIFDQLIAVNPDAPIPYVNKRIALMKWMAWERKQKEFADQDAQENRKQPEKLAEAKARGEQHQAKADALKVQIDEVSQKFTEVQKAAKAAKK
jgi:tetratricopeptide (TPR) repeat protein